MVGFSLRLCDAFMLLSCVHFFNMTASTAQVTAKELAELRSFRNPPAVVCQVLEAHPTKCNLSTQLFMLAVLAVRSCSCFFMGCFMSLYVLKKKRAVFHFGRSLFGQTFALTDRGITLPVQGSCLL